MRFTVSKNDLYSQEPLARSQNSDFLWIYFKMQKLVTFLTIWSSDDNNPELNAYTNYYHTISDSNNNLTGRGTFILFIINQCLTSPSESNTLKLYTFFLRFAIVSEVAKSCERVFIDFNSIFIVI